MFRSQNLKLKKKPTYKDIIKAIESEPSRYDELVFCGYGEPLSRLDILKKVARWLKSKNRIVRINTTGHANLIYNKNICPELKGIVDKICISLNGENKNKYLKTNKPKFGIKTFDAVIEFIKECRKYIPDVTVTTVAIPGIDIAKCRKIAKELGVKFVVRPYLTGYEES